MGSRMAKNLIKKGHNLKTYDVVPSATTAVPGTKPCQSPEEAVKDSSLVITMLPNGKIVKETVLGRKDFIQFCDGAKLDSFHLNCRRQGYSE